MPSLIQWIPRMNLERDETNYRWAFWEPDEDTEFYSLIIKKEKLNV